MRKTIVFIYLTLLKGVLIRRKAIGVYITLLTGIVLWKNTLVSNQFGWKMYDYLIENAVVETAATNIVTAIYLNYRYYDTLFEALMLLFSIIAVIYMSVHEGGEHYE